MHSKSVGEKLISGFLDKKHLLKTDPATHLVTSLVSHEDDKLQIFKKFIFKENFNKPNTYNLTQDGNVDIYEEVDLTKFNFTKINKDEIIDSMYLDLIQCESNSKYDDFDVITVNSFPLCMNHMLYIPSFYQILPQYLNSSGEDIFNKILNLNLNLSRDSEEDFIIGYNSKGGSSSVNHLHFHILSLKDLGLISISDVSFLNLEILRKEKIAFQRNKPEPLEIDNCIAFCENKIYKYFEISINYNTNIVKYVKIILDILHSMKIAYNIIITRSKMYIFPRKHENILPSNIKKFAFVEILGMLIFNTEIEYKNYKMENYLEEIKEIWLDENEYSSIIDQLKKKKI